RFLFPAMRVGAYELYWHRPLVAYVPEGTATPALVPDAPLGYVTAYDADRPDLEQALEVWPRLLQRPQHQAAVQLFDPEHAQPWLRASSATRTTPTACSIR